MQRSENARGWDGLWTVTIPGAERHLGREPLMPLILSMNKLDAESPGLTRRRSDFSMPGRLTTYA